FKPEFLNRIDETVIFKPLSMETQFKIVGKLLNTLKNRLLKEGYEIEFKEDIKKYIIDNAYSYEYGARPIKRFIQRNIETYIAKSILSSMIDENYKYLIGYSDDFVLTKIGIK
ncbi:MAG: hypothetical protein WC008_06620, partial [Bacilli bacterium]